MTIPKHDDLRVPALKLLCENESLKLKEFELPLAKTFNLTEQELSQEYDSGNGKIFYDRISWALSYMNMTGLVQKPKRGTYQISDIGIEQLKTPELGSMDTVKHQCFWIAIFRLVDDQMN